MDGSEDPPVLEGFICPICKTDLLSPSNLLNHFQEKHSDEQDLIKTFKDLFGKAKKKILKQDSSFGNTNSYSRHSSAASFEFFNDIPQELGAIGNNTKLFQMLREDRVQRLTTPTNRLIIRLDKLLDNMPSDLIKKKAHEQSVVAWIDGTTVNRCPDCAGSFHLARRKHHCRTCGGIMCNDCSHFMNLNTARKILNKDPESEESSQNGELQLRLCIHCISLLERRERKREFAEANPEINQLYSLLSEARGEAEKHLFTYNKMYKSLHVGESIHSLQDAQVLRARLAKLAETIDALSARIGNLGSSEGESKGLLEGKLQSAVRVGAMNFLRTKLLNLPNLPTKEQLELRQEQRRRERERQAPQSRQVSSGLSPTASAVPSTTSPSESQALVFGQGWIPEERKQKVNESHDPLIEQMNIIRGYIQEARRAQKFDEVESLEQNLSELKKEYWKKQQIEDVSGEDGSLLDF